MTEDDDTLNPAVAKHLTMPPAVLEAIASDPKAVRAVAGPMAMIVYHDLVMARDKLAPAVKLALADSLAKLGDLAPQKITSPVGGDNGFSLVINIPSQAGSGPQAIEMKAVKTVENGEE